MTEIKCPFCGSTCSSDANWSTGDIYWECQEKSCRARGPYNDDDGVLFASLVRPSNINDSQYFSSNIYAAYVKQVSELKRLSILVNRYRLMMTAIVDTAEHAKILLNRPSNSEEKDHANIREYDSIEVEV